MKFNHIVHPTDFSETSLNAFRYACEIAKLHNSTIHLVHVFQKPYYSVTSPTSGNLTWAVDNEGMAELRHNIQSAIEHMAEMDCAKGLTIYRKLIPDIPVWQVTDHLEADKTDLIVMGTQGVTGIIHGGLVGTNTERVIRRSPYPVFSIPSNVEFYGVKKILFCTDFGEGVDSVYPHVVDFAKLFNAQIVFGTVNTRDSYLTNKFARAQYEILTSRFPYANTDLVIHNDDSIEEGIIEMVLNENIDVLAMLTHGRRGIAHLLYGSLAEDLSATLKTPMLTFKPVLAS